MRSKNLLTPSYLCSARLVNCCDCWKKARLTSSGRAEHRGDGEAIYAKSEINTKARDYRKPTPDNKRRLMQSDAYRYLDYI
jgi:hypothetical protein